MKALRSISDTDDTDEQGKSGFFKNLIGGGGGGMMAEGDAEHQRPKDMPVLVYLLPVIGFIGVGAAIAAYCAFGS